MKIKKEGTKKLLIFFIVLVIIISSGMGFFYFFSWKNARAPHAPPQSPSNLSAMLVDGKVVLSWRCPSSNGSAPLLGYRIYRNSSGKGFIKLATVKNATEYIDKEIYPGDIYRYYVTAFSSAGESNRSNIVDIKVVIPPSPPRNLNAYASNSAVTLLWDPPMLTGGAPITGYKIYRGTSPDSLTFLSKVNSTEYADRNVVSEITYYYGVSAVNIAGESRMSNVIGVTPRKPISPPSAPLNVSATLDNGVIILSWNPPLNDGGAPVTGYRIYRGMESGFLTLYATLGNITDFVDENITQGNTYYYQVSGVNRAGEGPRSNVVSISVNKSASAHGVISITSNDDFKKYASTGDGTAKNPWIIENYTLTQEYSTSVENYVIKIVNTSAFFIIRNCTINFIFPVGTTGIYLKNVSNGIIEDNSIYMVPTGFNIEDSRHITITQNFLNETFDGIHVENSEDISINSNHFEWVEEYVIVAQSSQDVRITENDFKGDYAVAIYVNGQGFTISGNKIHGGISTGIVVDASNCIIAENIVENIYTGISMETPFWWNIFNNNSNISIIGNVFRNVSLGIYIGGFGEVRISNNIIDSIGGGILLESSVNDTISGNKMFHSGIYINGPLREFWTTHIIDSNNLVNGLPVYFQKNKRGGEVNSTYGEIILANCTDFNIRGVKITNTTAAIIAGYSRNITIEDTLLENNIYNVVLWNVTNSIFRNNTWKYAHVSFIVMGTDIVVEGNTISHSTYGLAIWGNHNIFINNTVMENEMGFILNGNSSMIYQNKILYNYDGINIEGFSSNSTIIENLIRGNRYGIQVEQYYDFVKLPGNHGRILNNTITENLFGISVTNYNNITVNNNKIYRNSLYGVFLDRSKDITLKDNYITDNEVYGIHLKDSTYITILSNQFVNDSISLEGNKVSYWNTHTINTENLVNGKPVYYLKNQIGVSVPSDAGEVILANSSHITIHDLDITHATAAILIGFSNYSIVERCEISNARWGIALFYSSNSAIYKNQVERCGFGIYISGVNNTLNRNSIMYNGIGVYLEGFNHTLKFNRILGNYYGVDAFSTDSLIYLNDFINNTIQAYDGGENRWDNGSVGNYWSDYNGTDSNGDGIGDTPYHIPGGDNSDSYPLIRPISS